MKLFLDINWEAEGSNVKEAIFAIVKSHDLYELMSDAEKVRFDDIFDMMYDKSKDPKPKESEVSVNKI